MPINRTLASGPLPFKGSILGLHLDREEPNAAVKHQYFITFLIFTDASEYTLSIDGENFLKLLSSLRPDRDSFMTFNPKPLSPDR
jgi:hypothetical protein